MRIGSACVMSAAVLLAACRSTTPLAPAPSSWLTATLNGTTVDGEISMSYSGTGHFTTTGLRRPAAPPLFLLHSRGIGDARDEGFELARAGDALPAPGRYALGAQQGANAFQMIFAQRRGDVTYRYTAQSGELHIAASSPQQIAGTFTFRSVFSGTCTGTDGRVECSVRALDPAGPALDVNGSFVAVPER